MTAYLQPGDKVHLSVPSSANGDQASESCAREIMDEYKNVGIHVFLVTQINDDRDVSVVSVIRESVGARFPRSAEKLKLVDDLPWQDPAETTEPPREPLKIRMESRTFP
jgi:hypothetical protein